MSEIPYGEWPSPVTASDVAGDVVSFGPVDVDGGAVYWLERRPSEDGRGVVVRADEDGSTREVTPADANVRTLVHEYGGGDFVVADGTVYYANFEDQRLYRCPADGSAGPDAEGGGEATPVTPAPETDHGLRYADAALSPDGERLYAVRERHEGPGADDEAVNELVAIPTDGSADPTVLAAGRDFYSFPRPSPSGDRLAWTTWDHPRMPWDGTELRVASVAADGSLADERVVAGGPEESVFQPAWGPDGRLHGVSDRTGWWNLYRFDLEGVAEEEATAEGVEAAEGAAPATNLTPEEAEFGVPQWGFGLATYAFLDDGRIAVVRNAEGRQSLRLLDAESDGEAGDAGDAGDRRLRETDLPFEVYPRTKLATDGTDLAFVAGGPTTPPGVVRWRPGGAAEESTGDGAAGDDPVTLRRSFDLGVDAAFVSEPEHVPFPTTDNETAYALYYPPTNPDCEAPAGEKPPLVTTVHGGPTSQTFPILDPGVQFWTTRGFGVCDVNYRGSTGYGRAYRDRLRGDWGVADADDCVNAARYLADEGRVDPERLAITGGSAGGYAVLCALAFRDAFDAGASHYGVADLTALAEHTHKFESRYLDGLVGSLPEDRDVYDERSPVHHAEGVDAPLLVLQGGEDRVVPRDQAEAMVDALVETGTPYAYVLFPEERHGFRTADARREALELELAFYGRAFGFAPADDLPELELRRGERATKRVE